MGRLTSTAPVTGEGVEAVTLDFYQTLTFHRTGIGRGRSLMEYLETHGIESGPWEHQVLYDVFEPHVREYDPGGSRAERARYYRRLARRVFHRLRIGAPDEEADRRALDIWEILGPHSLGVFPEVPGALGVLRAAGYRLAIVSNWQCGLGHFCAELGLDELVDDVLVSAEVGSEKPDAGIFSEACRRLGALPASTLHVGDSVVDDHRGASGAGLQTLLLRRDGAPAPEGVRSIATLDGLTELLCGG